MAHVPHIDTLTYSDRTKLRWTRRHASRSDVPCLRHRLNTGISSNGRVYVYVDRVGTWGSCSRRTEISGSRLPHQVMTLYRLHPSKHSSIHSVLLHAETIITASFGL